MLIGLHSRVLLGVSLFLLDGGSTSLQCAQDHVGENVASVGAGVISNGGSTRQLVNTRTTYSTTAGPTAGATKARLVSVLPHACG
jgi:hypothetical protein